MNNDILIPDDTKCVSSGLRLAMQKFFDDWIEFVKLVGEVISIWMKRVEKQEQEE